MRRFFRTAAWGTLFGASVAAAFPAAATSITVNHELIAPMSADACLARARESLRLAGLSLLEPSGSAAFAESGQYVVALYCIPAQGAIVVTAAGPEVSETDPLVSRVLQAWRDAAAPAPAPAPDATK
jgi:hypothetical protein